jgi:hypothetical protein
MIAPVSEGQVAGSITLTYNGVNLGTYDLITRNSVSRNNVLYVLDLLLDFLSGPIFRTALAIFLIGAAGYVAVLVFLRINRNRRRSPHGKMVPQKPTGRGSSPRRKN